MFNDHELDRIEFQFNSHKEHLLEMENHFIDELGDGERELFHDWIHQHPDAYDQLIESLYTLFRHANGKCLYLKPEEIMKILLCGISGSFMDDAEHLLT